MILWVCNFKILRIWNEKAAGCAELRIHVYFSRLEKSKLMIPTPEKIYSENICLFFSAEVFILLIGETLLKDFWISWSKEFWKRSVLSFLPVEDWKCGFVGVWLLVLSDFSNSLVNSCSLFSRLIFFGIIRSIHMWSISSKITSRIFICDKALCDICLHLTIKFVHRLRYRIN